MERKVKILPPSMPNFIRMEMKPGKKQDGFHSEMGAIPVADLSEQEAIEYGELMKQTFIEHWKKLSNG